MDRLCVSGCCPVYRLCGCMILTILRTCTRVTREETTLVDKVISLLLNIVKIDRTSTDHLVCYPREKLKLHIFNNELNDDLSQQWRGMVANESRAPEGLIKTAERA